MSFSEWQECNLGQVCKITMGQSPKSEFYNTEGNGVVFLQGNRTFGDKYPIYDTFTSIVTKLANVGDVIMSVRAPVGDVNIATLETCLGRGICGLRMYNNNQEFLYYLMKYNSVNLIKKESGTVFGSINKGDINSLKVKIPTLDSEQKAIADILSSLDEKIELNNQMNKTLEEMAQSIFKRWFVDFNFPDGEGEPYKDSGGKMVESELGMIPEGWEVGVFSDLVEITSGKRPGKRSEIIIDDNIYPLVGASSVMGYTEKYNFNEKILVIGRVGTHGVVQRFDQMVWASDNTLVIKSEIYEFAYQILNCIDYSVLNRGSTQPLITQTDIKNYSIVIPSEEWLSKFENLIQTLFDVHSNNVKESLSLINIRDTLLPKLMSGEIRVNNLENEI